MNKNTKILILGGYGSHNWGDDLQLYNNIRILREKGFNNIKIISRDSYIGELCKCKTIPSCHKFYNNYSSENIKELKTKILIDDFPELSKALEWSDVLFFSGSGTLNTRNLVPLYIYLTPIILASRLNKIIILSGQGFTPMNNAYMEEFIAMGLSKVNKIFTRDFNYGYKALQRIGIDLSKVELGVDDAFTSKGDKIDLPPKTIGINISCFIQPNLIPEFYNLAVLLKKEGYNPIFNYFQRETELIQKVTKNNFPIYTFKSPENLVGFHHACYGYVGMRYHSTILCLSGKTPVVNISGNIYQQEKINAIVDRTKIENISLTFKEANTDNMYNTLMKAIETQPPKLKIINKKWNTKANLAINYLEAL